MTQISKKESHALKSSSTTKLPQNGTPLLNFAIFVIKKDILKKNVLSSKKPYYSVNSIKNSLPTKKKAKPLTLNQTMRKQTNKTSSTLIKTQQLKPIK